MACYQNSKLDIYLKIYSTKLLAKQSKLYRCVILPALINIFLNSTFESHYTSSFGLCIFLQVCGEPSLLCIVSECGQPKWWRSARELSFVQPGGDSSLCSWTCVAGSCWTAPFALCIYVNGWTWLWLHVVPNFLDWWYWWVCI